jgi:hypothetical protein
MFQQRKFLKLFFSVVIPVILLCVLINAFAYEPFMDQIDRWPDGGDFNPEDYYQINPNTIVSSLDQGLLNVFTPKVVDDPEKFWEENWQENYDSFQWHQEDFLKIAVAINQFAANDNFTDWGISTASFTIRCENYQQGFSDLHLIIFKPIWNNGQLYYEAREIWIVPDYKIIRWGDGRIYPRPIFGWNKVNLDDFQITAEQALSIAEQNGGKQLRLTEDNNCIISVIGDTDKWIVLYSPIAEYEIDSLTGEVLNYHEYNAK